MKIGNVEFKNNVFLAPMAGITDLAFRLICKEMGVGLVYSEMVSCKGLYYNDYKTEELMEIDEFERPIALQIFGSDSKIMSSVVYEKLNKREDIDIIDINMGCPAPKIVKNGDGSALMKQPKLVGEIIKSITKVSNKPVTVKIRTGWDKTSINAVEIAKIAEDNGASMVAVHGRTRDQFYSGEADWNIIKNVKENITIPVVGNGDIFTAEDGKRMLDYTGCDAIMIGRGSRGNPWIFSRIVNFMQNGELSKLPSEEEKIAMIIKHFKLLTEIKNERIAVREMRKHIGWYIKGMKNSAEMRNKINRLDTKEEVLDELHKYMEKIR